MKNLGIFKNLIASFGILAMAAPGFASPINVIPATASDEAQIKAKLKARTIGMMKLPNGQVKFKGSSVNVGAIPEWLFDRHTVLKGSIIKSRIEGSGNATQIRGLAYFTGGDWIGNLDNKRRRDNLTTDTGSILVGKVRAVNDDSVDFQLVTGQTKRIKKANIAKLVSPRAFFFHIPAANVKIDSTTGTVTGEATTLAFNPTLSRKKRRWFAKKHPIEPKSVLAGTEGGITKTQIAGLVALDAANTIAPLVIFPIVASPLGSKAANRQLDEFHRLDEILIRSSDIVIIP